MPLSSPAPKKSTRLDATLLDRILARPGWSRTILVRRVAAASLALTAVVMFARDAAATDHVRIKSPHHGALQLQADAHAHSDRKDLVHRTAPGKPIPEPAE